MPNRAHTTVRSVPLRSQDSAGILLAHLSQAAPRAAVAPLAACTSAAPAPAGRRSMHAFYLFLHRGDDATPAKARGAARDCKTLLRSRFLRSRASEKLLRHDITEYTDLALESRPLAGFYTTPRNGVIAVEAEFTKISVTFCAYIPDAFFLSLRNNRVIDRSGGSSNGIVVS